SWLKILLKRRSAAHYFDDLTGNRSLADSVHTKSETIYHLRSILCGRIHGRHASSVLGSYRFNQGLKDLRLYIVRQQSTEDLGRGLLIDIIDLGLLRLCDNRLFCLKS